MRTRSDKGWGQLPRRIARALAGLKINGEESRVVWAIVYYTFAWTKQEDWITWGQLAEITGITEWHLSRPINSLLKKGVIFMKANRYGVQLDFSKWETPPSSVVSAETPPSSEKTPPSSVVSLDPIPRTNLKEGLSTKSKKKKIEEYKSGIAMIKEAIGKTPEK